MGEWIRLKAADGHELDAYRAAPPDTIRGGIVVIQEIFGVNSHIRAVCREWAAEGYVVVAPALFDRLEPKIELDYGEASVSKGRDLRMRLGWHSPMLDIEASIAALRLYGRVATMGFCWGGSLSFLAACRTEIDCAVAYYGGQIIQFVEERPKAPVLMHFGEKDPLIPKEDRDRILATRPEVEAHVYPSGHGFNCNQRADHDPASAKLAKERTLAFLRRHLQDRESI